jgi:serine/threonine protein kinase
MSNRTKTAPQAKRPHRFKAIVQPQPQTLRVTSERPRRRVGLNPRSIFELGAAIGDDLTVIGHLSVGAISELYQVWSNTYLCALTCKILLPKFAPHSKEARGLQREATLRRRLAHPHIVHILGQGVYDGRALLVQEYPHGPSSV